MDFSLGCEQEVDSRWIAEVPELSGVLAYGDSSADAMARAEVLALRVRMPSGLPTIEARLDHMEALLQRLAERVAVSNLGDG